MRTDKYYIRQNYVRILEVTARLVYGASVLVYLSPSSPQMGAIPVNESPVVLCNLNGLIKFRDHHFVSLILYKMDSLLKCCTTSKGKLPRNPTINVQGAVGVFLAKPGSGGEGRAAISINPIC